MHSNTIYALQLQKTIVLRMQPLHQVTLTQPFQCDLQPALQETNRTTHTGTTISCKTHRRHDSRTKRPQPHPSHRRGTFHRRLQPLYTEKQGFVLRLPPHNIAHVRFTQPFQCDLQPQLQETHRMTYTGTTMSCKTHKTTPAAPVAQTRYLSSPAAATLHGKTQGFVLRLPPHNIAHVTFMHPFQCDLQPALQETHRTTHTGTTISCKTHRRNDSRTKRPQPHPSHRRGTFHRRLLPLYTEKHKVSCSGFLPTT